MRQVEEIAALNLAKFRQTQNSLGSAEERAEAGETVTLIWLVVLVLKT